jgi:thiosulfate/3-mercaptopyruvate sulfurtransferase
MDNLVSAEWLRDRLRQPGVVVLDATLWLPHEGRDAHAEFVAAHIPGALFFDIEAFSDPDTPLPHMVPSPGRFARLAGALGIGPGSEVVVYDQRGIFSAPRAWWLFRLFGHPAVAVLDGGLPAWRAAGFDIEQGERPPPAPQTFHADLHAAKLRGLGEVRDAIASGSAMVIDARPAARFAGSVPEPRPGVRPGHIPGAASLPFPDLLDAQQKLLPPDRLRAVLARAGIDGGRPVTTYCGSGVTAAVLNFAMLRAGLPEGSLYDGSWTEWGSRPDLPVET